MTALGFDLALNHSGAVALDEAGELEDYWFTSDKKRAVDQGGGRGVRISPKPKGMDAENYQLRRMMLYRKWFWDVLKKSGAEYAGVEGYAMHAESNSHYQYGELGGLARLTLARYSVKTRIHDPMSVKIFSSGKGNAKKHHMVEALPTALQDAWARIDHMLKDNQTLEDLADAYWLAKLVWTEIESRAGRMLMSDLSEHQRRVFLRTTKAYPVNVLDRDFLEWP